MKPFCTLNHLTNLSIFFELVLCCHVFLKLASHSKISCGDRHTQSLIKQDLFPWKTGPKRHLNMLHTHPSSCMGSAILHWAWIIQDMCTQPLAIQPCEGFYAIKPGISQWCLVFFLFVCAIDPFCQVQVSVVRSKAILIQACYKTSPGHFTSRRFNESWKSHHLFQSV